MLNYVQYAVQLLLLLYRYPAAVVLNCTFYCLAVGLLKRYTYLAAVVGALMICPPTNRPRDIATQTKHPPDKPSAIIFYYCGIPSQSVWVVIHPKLWHSDLVNLEGLSQCYELTRCNILSQSLWHFIHVFIIQICCDISSQCNKRCIFPENLAIFTHFHIWQLILKEPCMSLTINHSSSKTWSSPHVT